MKCPYLIVHGGHDVLTGSAARNRVTITPRQKASMSTLRFISEEETGAEHCQHDNPTIGQELLSDWLADLFGIDQKALLKRSWNPLI